MSKYCSPILQKFFDNLIILSWSGLKISSISGSHYSARNKNKATALLQTRFKLKRKEVVSLFLVTSFLAFICFYSVVKCSEHLEVELTAQAWRQELYPMVALFQKSFNMHTPKFTTHITTWQDSLRFNLSTLCWLQSEPCYLRSLCSKCLHCTTYDSVCKNLTISLTEFTGCSSLHFIWVLMIIYSIWWVKWYLLWAASGKRDVLNHVQINYCFYWMIWISSISYWTQGSEIQVVLLDGALQYIHETRRLILARLPTSTQLSRITLKNPTRSFCSSSSLAEIRFYFTLQSQLYYKAEMYGRILNRPLHPTLVLLHGASSYTCNRSTDFTPNSNNWTRCCTVLFLKTSNFISRTPSLA